MAENATDTLISNLIVEDLNLKEEQFEIIRESSSLDGSAVCTVHQSWLRAAQCGDKLPAEVPKLTPSYLHWLMQPSCGDDRIPAGWHLVKVICLSKEGVSSSYGNRVLSAWRMKWSTNEFSSFLSQLACQNQQLSWRQFINNTSSSSGKVVKQKPLSEEYVHSIIRQLYNQRIIKIGSNTHSSHGDEDSLQLQDYSGPANLIPLLCALESEKAFYFVVPHYRHTLFDLVTHSSCAIGQSTSKPLFIFYQLLQLLSQCHEHGVTFGEFGLRDIFIDDRLWITMATPLSTLSHKSFESRDVIMDDVAATDNVTSDTSKLSLCDALHQWQNGVLSNLDYLLCLNYHAGRKFGEPNNHPVVPWVTDFSQPNGGYRDLSKSKHRLNKGDQQLDFTYVNAKEQLKTNPHLDSVYPHHIGDLLSDVTYYMYRARCTPKELLCSRVRPRWVPGEYPSSMRKMYEWTPDECIPEFYTDPSIFSSVHDDLPDLAVPSWSVTAEEFVQHHRSILEGDYVSAHLHNWIDLTFGYKLQGDPAVKAKNIHLALVDGHTRIYSHGIVQLFNVAHPKRLTLNPTPYAIKHPLYNPFNALHYGVADNVMPLDTPSKKGDTVQRIKRTMSRKELKEHLEQPLLTGDEQMNTTPPSMEVLDEHGFLDVSVHYPEIMSDKVSVPREGKSKEGLLPLSLWSSRPKPSRIRQRKPGVEEIPIIEYPWQHGKIQLPKDFLPSQNITRVEETGLFIYRALGEATMEGCWTKDDIIHNATVTQHGLFHVLEKKDKNYQLSFEEQVAVDTFSAICTAVEMYCNDQLRAMMLPGATLSQRFSLLIKLHKQDNLLVPNFLHKVMSNYFTDSFSLTSTTTQGLPGISAPLILQQCIPIVCFPSHFQFLHTKLSELDHFLQMLHYSQFDSCHDNFITSLCDYLTANVSVIVSSLDSESLQLFILHLMPYFNNYTTSFDTILTTFESITKYLNCDEIIRVFSPLLQDLYDHTSLSPQHKAQILHRPFLNMLIHRFGLAHFRDRYISHVVEAVINPSGVHSKKEHRKGQNLTLKDEQLHVVKKEQSVTPGESKQLSLLLDEPEYSSDEEGDDMVGETYTSLLAHTPVQTPSKQTAPVKEERTISVCSDDLISMEPIVVISPPGLQPVNDEDTASDADTLNGTHLLSYRDSPDITTGNSAVSFSLVPPEDITSDQGDATSDQASSDLLIGHPLMNDMYVDDDYKVKSDDDTDGGNDDKDDDKADSDTDKDDDIGSIELSQDDKMLADVAADSLQWLIHKLGPLLATKYIVRPLLDGLYRCFTSHHSNQEVAVLKCLSQFVSSYGNIVVMKMFIPHAEYLIEAAKKQLNHKSEGGLMASLAILQLCFEYMPEKTLEDNMHVYCSEIFHPITQFICSPSYVFAAGWKMRLRLCHLFIGTISFVGKKLGREGALKFLTGVLQLFFTGFDVVYGVGLMQRDNSLIDNMETSEEPRCQVTIEDAEESVPLVSKAMLMATPSKLARNLGSHLGDDTDSKENFVPIQQLCKVFTPKLAHSAYVKMCLVLGQLNLRRELYNTELVEQITYSHDEVIHVSSTFPQPTHFAPSCHSSDQSGYTSCDSGDECDLVINNLGPFMNINKGLSYEETDYGRSLWFVDLFDGKEKSISSGHLMILDDQPSQMSPYDGGSERATTLDINGVTFETKFGGLASQDSLTTDKRNNTRKLKTMWAALWETRCQNLRSPYKFHNIKLQTYIGHKAAVKHLCVPNDEEFFFSASKDRTVKIWSLRNRDDDVEMYNYQRAYTEHQRPLLGVQYVHNLQQVVSCDSTLHLWDPETGYCIRQVSPTAQGVLFTAMAVVPIAFQPLVALGTSDSQLQFYDVRSKCLVHKWKVVGLEPNGVVKCIACDEHLKWLAVGSNNDVIATLHPHTGEVLSSWKTADFSTGTWKPYTYSYESDSILQLKATRRGLLVSSNGNGITSLWRPKAGGLVHHIKVGSPSIHSLEVYKDSLFAVNSNNQIFVYRSYDIYNRTTSPSQYKLQSKTLKGNISSIAILPNNQTVLMGSDSGQIALMA